MAPDRSVKCLVVDDDHDGAEAISAFLTLFGANVQVVHGGPDAILSASQFEPRLVVLDINMPGMDGLETCRRLRQQPWSGDAVFIAYTGVSYPKAVALAAGFDHVVTKGDPPQVFETIVKGLLR
jgi:CheY-like chemotaxis protein